MVQFFNFNSTIKSRLVCSFITKLFNFSVIPFMAIFLTSLSNSFYAGVILIINTVVSFLSGFVGGFVSDNLNRKKWFLIGIISNGVLLILLGAFSSSSNISFICISIFFICNSLVFSFYSPFLTSMLIEATNENNKKIVFTYDYWVINTSMALGFLIGGIFFDNYKNLLFFIAGILTLIVSFVYGRFIDQMKNNKKLENVNFKSFLSNYKRPLSNKYFLIFLIFGAIIISSESTLTNYISVKLSEDFLDFFFKQYINGTLMLSILRIINTTIIVFCTFFISKIIKNIPLKNTFILGALFYSFSYIFMPINLNFWTLIILIILASIGEIIFAPGYQTIKVSFMEDNYTASYSALASISVQLSSAIASFYLIINDYINDVTIFFIMSSLSVLSIFILKFIIRVANI